MNKATKNEQNAFKASLAICGLTQSEAAAYLEVSLQSIKHWSSGKTSPPSGVWEELASLWEEIQQEAASIDVDLADVNPRDWGNQVYGIPGAITLLGAVSCK